MKLNISAYNRASYELILKKCNITVRLCALSYDSKQVSSQGGEIYAEFCQLLQYI